MTRLLCGLALAAAIGCTGIQPVGPMAGKKGLGPDPKAEPPDPVTIPAATPTPPKCIVHADDVTAENVDAIKKQLQAEFEADRKSMPSAPVTVEVTHPQQ